MPWTWVRRVQVGPILVVAAHTIFAIEDAELALKVDRPTDECRRAGDQHRAGRRMERSPLEILRDQPPIHLRPVVPAVVLRDRVALAQHEFPFARDGNEPALWILPKTQRITLADTDVCVPLVY